MCFGSGTRTHTALVLQQNIEAAHNVLGRGGLLMAFRGGIYCWRGCKRLFGVISSKSRLLSPTKAQQTDVKWQLLFFLKSLTPDVENDFGHSAGLFLSLSCQSACLDFSVFSFTLTVLVTDD